MDIATANLFPDESDGSEDFKLVKVARECRASQMKNPKSGVLMIGMLHSRLTTANANAIMSAMVTRMRRARGKLISFGLFDKDIGGFIPLIQAPIIDDIITVTARDIPPDNPYKGFDFCSVDDIVNNAAAPDDPDKIVTAKTVLDPFDDDGGATITTQIEVSVFEATGIKRKLPGEYKFTMKLAPGDEVSAAKVKEMALEITPIKTTLKNQLAWGIIQKVEFSATVSGKTEAKIDNGKVKRLFDNFSTEVKASLEADVKIPRSSVKIHVEGSLKSDLVGKPKAGLEFSWDF